MFLKGYDIDVNGRAETLGTDVATLKVIKLVKLCQKPIKFIGFQLLVWVYYFQGWFLRVIANVSYTFVSVLLTTMITDTKFILGLTSHHKSSREFKQHQYENE